MANLNFQYSSAPLRAIQEIQFGLLSPEEIKNMSVAQIEYPETMDEQNQRPRQMGLADPRLGLYRQSSQSVLLAMRICPSVLAILDISNLPYLCSMSVGC